jgi:2-polyprenyl-6-methoxyphenol hydroxylase-like FAD-dependent oxidoreductase
MLAARDVVVVGAGIGGAAAALLLARRGARVTLLERVREPRAVGAGILLQPNGLAVLYGLGLRDALTAQATIGRDIRLADGRGRVLAGTPVPDLGGGYDHVLVLRRSRLLTVLIEAVRAEPAITCRFGCDVTRASPDGRVAWHDGTGEGGTQADLVVGADGLHSRVRDVGRFDPILTPGPTYLRGLSRVAQAGPMTEYWTSIGIFGAGAVDDATYFYASTTAPPLADALARRDLDGLRGAWRRVCPTAGEAFAGVERVDDLLVNQVTRVDCGRWHDGRLVLLGDAAHAMAPNLGQGANSALVDAVVLGDALAGGGDVSAALGAYETRRRPAVRRVQNAAAVLAWLGEVRSALARRIRDGWVRLVLSRLGSDGSFRRSLQEDPLWLERAARGPW